MVLYMAVTPDELELPIAVETSVTFLGKKLGINPRNITQGISRSYKGVKTGCKFLKVEVEDNK